ncbi:MAG TPA: 50S ribosomal protein L11 methyltransferase [Pyrinomonadaceae bacterium]|nr:50S ribosomal protein L11 methyltransferase [Pyrinomonadaceae bacterium]
MSHEKAQKAQKSYAVDVDVEPDAGEAVAYALMEAGALGTETKENVVAGYFAEVPNRERIRDELFEALRIYDLPSSSVRDMNLREVEQRDWLEEWKENWLPVEVGSFIIAPPWSELGDVREQIVIRIEPGMAFGTGTHETTRLCLNAIQKHFAGGSFLDVGTGTGILAIAAAKLSPEARIEAFDTDELALTIARENARANKVLDQIDFRVGSIGESTASADLVCANLTANVIVPLLPTLVSLTCGKLILSGILDTQIEMVQAALHDCGVSEFEIAQDGEWVALII